MYIYPEDTRIGTMCSKGRWLVDTDLLSRFRFRAFTDGHLYGFEPLGASSNYFTELASFSAQSAFFHVASDDVLMVGNAWLHRGLGFFVKGFVVKGFVAVKGYIAVDFRSVVIFFIPFFFIVKTLDVLDNFRFISSEMDGP